MLTATNTPNRTITVWIEKSSHDQQRVDAEHHQDAQVLVEVLHRDRMAGAHQDVAAVLQQRVHRHHEEAGERADQRSSAGCAMADVADEDHDDHDEAHRDAERQHVDRAVAAGRTGPRAPRRWRCRPRRRPAGWTPATGCSRAALAAQSITMNCSVAPAPQNSVVVASEIWPSLSRHSSRTQCAKSRIRNRGFVAWRAVVARRCPECRG